MRVLCVTNMYPSPETPVYGIHVSRQNAALASLGHELEVLFVDGRHSSVAYATAVGTIARTAARFRPDVVHVHYGLTAFPAAVVPTAPMIVSLCGDDVFGTARPGGITMKSRIARSLTRLGCRRARAIITKSQLMHDRVSAWGFQSTVIPNGVDVAFFHPLDQESARAELGLRRDRRYVLFAANPTTYVKRFDIAQDVVARLRATGADVELLTVSAASAEVVRLHYAAADVLILPSMSEGSANVLKEAMACALPTVAFDVGDAAWLARGLSRHRVVPRLAVDQMVLEIERMFSHAQQDGTLPRGDGRERIETEVSDTTVARRVEAIYRRVTDA